MVVVVVARTSSPIAPNGYCTVQYDARLEPNGGLLSRGADAPLLLSTSSSSSSSIIVRHPSCTSQTEQAYRKPPLKRAFSSVLNCQLCSLGPPKTRCAPGPLVGPLLPTNRLSLPSHQPKHPWPTRPLPPREWPVKRFLSRKLTGPSPMAILLNSPLLIGCNAVWITASQSITDSLPPVRAHGDADPRATMPPRHAAHFHRTHFFIGTSSSPPPYKAMEKCQKAVPSPLVA